MRRSMLFLPANSPKMLLNGDALDADSLIIDLEDGVSIGEKDAARILAKHIMQVFDRNKHEIIVRINDISTPFWKKDISAVIPMEPDIILPTKINCAQDITTICEFLASEERRHGIEVGTIRLMPLLETAKGIENAYEIATASPRLCALYLGAEDLTASLRCKRTSESHEIFYSRSRVVCAARAAGIEAYDTPFTDISNTDLLEKDARLARDLGFTGKAVINPRQIQIVNEVFSPTVEEIAYAKNVLDAFIEGQANGKGVISLDGKMIDMPIVNRARQILNNAGQMKGNRAL